MIFKNFKQTYYNLKHSSLVRSASIYTVSSFINASIPFLLLPILTTKLSPEDYGIVAMFLLVVSAIYPLIGMNLESSITRKFFDDDKTHFPEYVGTCIILSIFGLIIVSLVFIFFFNSIQEVTQIPSNWLMYTLLVAEFQFISTLLLVLHQINVKAIKYGIIQISQTIINISLTIIFVLILNKKWDGRLSSQIITGFVFATIALIILLKEYKVKLKLNLSYAKNSLKFGLPLIPHAVGGMLFTAVDRFFLTNYVGLAQTGNYSVAYQIGAIISLLTGAFNSAYSPWLFENLKKDDNTIKIKIVKLTYLYFITIVIIAIALQLLFPIIVSIFVGPAFTYVNSFSFFIILGFVFQGMYFMVTNYIFFAKKTYLLAIVTISVGLLKIPITYLSIIIWGSIGASISWSITFLIFFIATWLLSTRVYKMPWLLSAKFKKYE